MRISVNILLTSVAVVEVGGSGKVGKSSSLLFIEYFAVDYLERLEIFVFVRAISIGWLSMHAQRT